jgi:hypothetical protein
VGTRYARVWFLFPAEADATVMRRNRDLIWQRVSDRTEVKRLSCLELCTA